MVGVKGSSESPASPETSGSLIRIRSSEIAPPTEPVTLTERFIGSSPTGELGLSLSTF